MPPILTPSEEVSEVVGRHLPVAQALEAVIGAFFPRPFPRKQTEKIHSPELLELVQKGAHAVSASIKDLSTALLAFF